MGKKYKYRHREMYKNVWIDVKADTNKDLFQKVKNKKDKIDNGFVDSNIPLKTFCDRFLTTYKKYKVSPAWYAELEKISNKMVNHIGNKPIGKIKAIEVQEFINSYSDKSDSYIKKIYDLANQVFNRAYIDGLINNKFYLERIKGKKAVNGRSLTNYERGVLLKVLDGHRGELFCKLMLFCGLRAEEAAALIWRDIDFNKSVLTVNKAIKRDDTLGEPKSSASNRQIPIPAHFLNLLVDKKGSPFDLVCPTANGGFYKQSSKKRMWANIKRLMNIEMGCKVYRNELIPPYPLDPDFKMHYLRHTYCTDLELAGVPINIAKNLMGHSSIEVTAKIYTHFNDETLEMARNLINVGNLVGNKISNV